MEPQRVCDCSRAPGWGAGKWKDPWCHDGKCYSGQPHGNCKGKANGYQLGDGTWCHDGRRDTKCPAITSKNTISHNQWFCPIIH